MDQPRVWMRQHALARAHHASERLWYLYQQAFPEDVDHDEANIIHSFTRIAVSSQSWLIHKLKLRHLHCRLGIYLEIIVLRLLTSDLKDIRLWTPWWGWALDSCINCGKNVNKEFSYYVTSLSCISTMFAQWPCSQSSSSLSVLGMCSHWRKQLHLTIQRALERVSPL